VQRQHRRPRTTEVHPRQQLAAHPHP
jgi:hypothetical protein